MTEHMLLISDGIKWGSLAPPPAGTVVYLLETGCYENAGVVGVYATAEAAMAAHSPERPKGARGVRGHGHGKRAGEPWTYEWSGPDKNGSYHFGADWDDAAEIRPEVVRHSPREETETP